MTKKFDTVYAPGVWDLFHVGHANVLRRAKRIGGTLIVGVDTDESVKEKKGRYPVIPEYQRYGVIQAIRWVDKIVLNKNCSVDVEKLKDWGVNAVVLGRDEDWDWNDLAGYKEAKDAGIEFIRIPYTQSISTTLIKMQIREDRTALEEIRT